MLAKHQIKHCLKKPSQHSRQKRHTQPPPGKTLPPFMPCADALPAEGGGERDPHQMPPPRPKSLEFDGRDLSNRSKQSIYNGGLYDPLEDEDEVPLTLESSFSKILAGISLTRIVSVLLRDLGWDLSHWIHLYHSQSQRSWLGQQRWRLA
jgi:ribosomal protein S16